MTKEEIKQYLRNQIDSSIKRQFDDNRFDLCYNKNYVRVLKLSTITGKPVNKENFKGGVLLFGFNVKTKRVWVYSKIFYYLNDNYSKDSVDIYELLKEVLCEYDAYKSYKYINND